MFVVRRQQNNASKISLTTVLSPNDRETVLRLSLTNFGIKVYKLHWLRIEVHYHNIIIRLQLKWNAQRVNITMDER